jgi:Tfp pilus assembly protein PilE
MVMTDSSFEQQSKRRKLDDDDDDNMEEEEQIDDQQDSYFTEESTIIKPFPDAAKYIHRKRTALHGPKIQSYEIYISRKSNRQAILARAQSLFEKFTSTNISDTDQKKNKKQKQQQQKDTSEAVPVVHLHAMGAAINTCIDLALILQAQYCTDPKMFVMCVETGTVKLVDDFIPKREYEGVLEPVSQVRYNSAIHIQFKYIPKQNRK